MSKTTFLNFEQPMAELDAKIEELRFVQDDSAVDISEEIDRLAKKSQQLTKDIYAKLTPWQVNSTATARTRTTCRSSAAWRASMARPA
jgi:acetyl-CoA carboxylase carboxyl transferase subunit alpha